MALDFRSTTIGFPVTKDRVQVVPGSVNFGRPIRTAECTMKGFDVEYTDEDHHLKRLMIQVSSGLINGTVVSFNVSYLLRDDSGNIDDKYDGLVSVLVIADVE
jgi:hypothetical protein